MRKINVLQFICPAGFYGAEMWILALAKNLDPERVNCQLAITRGSEEQNIEIFDRFQALGLESYQINMRGRFDPRVILKFSSLIRKRKIDIIHTHGYDSDIIGIIAAECLVSRLWQPLMDLRMQKILNSRCSSGLTTWRLNIDCVSPLSEELRSDILSHKVRPERIRLIVNGVDLTEVEAEKSENLPLLFPHSEEKKSARYI